MNTAVGKIMMLVN